MLFPIIVYFLFASTVIVNKILLGFMPITFFVGVRLLLGGLLLLPFALKKSSRLHWQYLKQDWLILGCIILLTSFVPGLLKAYGLKNIYASKVMLMGSMDQVVTGLYAYFLLNECLSIRRIIGMAVVSSGVFWLCYSDFVFSYATLAILAYVVVSRLGWILVKKVLGDNRYSSVELNALTMIGAGSLSLMMSWFMGDMHFESIAHPGWCLALGTYSIIIGTVVGRTLYGFFLKNHSANFVTLSGFLESLFVILLGWLFLSEALSFDFILAAFIIFAGIYIFYSDEQRCR